MAPAALPPLEDLARAAALIARYPKFIKAGAGPSWLWLCALAYTQQTLFPMLVQEEAIDSLGVRSARRMAVHLESAGLWKRVTGGWEILPLDTPIPVKAVAPQQPPAVLAGERLRFPIAGRTDAWILTDAKVQEWRALYPNIDVLAECKKALAWSTANGAKVNVEKFLVNWLNREAVDRPMRASATTRGRTGAPPPNKYAPH